VLPRSPNKCNYFFSIDLIRNEADASVRRGTGYNPRRSRDQALALAAIHQQLHPLLHYCIVTLAKQTICRKVLYFSTMQFGPIVHTSYKKEHAFDSFEISGPSALSFAPLNNAWNVHQFQYNEEVKNAARVNLSMYPLNSVRQHNHFITQPIFI